MTLGKSGKTYKDDRTIVNTSRSKQSLNINRLGKGRSRTIGSKSFGGNSGILGGPMDEGDPELSQDEDDDDILMKNDDNSGLFPNNGDESDYE